MSIDWSTISDPCLLIDSLSKFLVGVFGEEFLREEVKKLDSCAPRDKFESFELLRPIEVHRVAKWFRLLENLRE